LLSICRIMRFSGFLFGKDSTIMRIVMGLLAFVSIALGAVGQIFLKIAATKSSGKLVDFYLGLLKSPFVYLGAFSYGVSFLLWMFLLKRFDISFLRPLMSFGYIITSLLAFFLLHEKITAMRWIGTILIVAGMVFMIVSLDKP
jgi:drug/metabolite transporter (DMT)-like permease